MTTKEDIVSNEQVETPAEFCEWLVSMNALSNVGSRGLVTLSNIIERADLALRAATPDVDALAEVDEITKKWESASRTERKFEHHFAADCLTEAVAAVRMLADVRNAVDVLAEVEAWCDDTERDIEPGDAYQTEVTDELDSQARAHVAQLRAILNPKAGR